MVKRDQVYLAATQKDEAAAVALAQGLERLRLPSSLSLDPSVQKLAEGRKVLRHGRENPREPRLPDLVRAKLAESAVMVLVCSSSSATSRWIRSEVEDFYRAHPRGPIIPVVLEGEPNPEKSRQAFEKPCFPDSLKRGDRDRWVDARGADWAETAPVATLAAMTGIRVEQLIFHEGMRADRMKRQRSGVLALLTLTLAFSLGWAFRWGIHEWALGNVPPYKGQIANKVERILDVTTSDREQGPMISFELTGRENETSVREISTPGQAPDRRSYPASAYGETTAFGVVPERNPEAFRIAVNAWLDEAERFLPDRSEEADRWIQSAKGSLEEQDKP
ncbi:MAG: toll/interleukin-1 receptor domain-containing protein, partial [Verrucomicrobiota bacterium]